MTTETEYASELFQSIAMVSSKVAALIPDKKNTQSNYQYISADRIYQEVGQAMAEVGLVIIPSIKSMKNETVEIPGRSGGTMRRYETTLEMEMLLGDERGAILRFPWVGMGVDYSSPDKAFACAQTTAMAYFIKMTFLVGKGNYDGEHNEVPEQVYTPKVPQKEVRSPPAPPLAPVRKAAPTPNVQAVVTSPVSTPVKAAPISKYDRNLPVEPLPQMSANQVKDIEAALDQCVSLSEWKAWMVSNKWDKIESIPARAFTSVMRFLKSKAKGNVPPSARPALKPSPKKVAQSANVLLLKSFNHRMLTATDEENIVVAEMMEAHGVKTPSEMTTEQLTEVMEVL